MSLNEDQDFIDRQSWSLFVCVNASTGCSVKRCPWVIVIVATIIFYPSPRFYDLSHACHSNLPLPYIYYMFNSSSWSLSSWICSFSLNVFFTRTFRRLIVLVRFVNKFDSGCFHYFSDPLRNLPRLVESRRGLNNTKCCWIICQKIVKKYQFHHESSFCVFCLRNFGIFCNSNLRHRWNWQALE